MCVGPSVAFVRGNFNLSRILSDPVPKGFYFGKKIPKGKSVRTLPKCTFSLPECTFTLPKCTLSLPECTFTLPKCTLSLPECTFTLLSLPECTFTLPNYALSLPECTFTLPKCMYTLTTKVFSRGSRGKLCLAGVQGANSV
jgi:hypothetical protein